VHASQTNQDEVFFSRFRGSDLSSKELFYVPRDAGCSEVAYGSLDWPGPV